MVDVVAQDPHFMDVDPADVEDLALNRKYDDVVMLSSLLGN